MPQKYKEKMNTTPSSSDDLVTNYSSSPKKNIKKNKSLNASIANSILGQLQYEGLTPSQAKILKKTLEDTIKNYEIEDKPNSAVDLWAINLDIIEKFLQSKRIQNCSKSTIYNYGNETRKLLQAVNKLYSEITSEDVRMYLDNRKMVDHLSNHSLHNIRMYLLSFFKWLKQEDMIKKNPMDNIAPVKLEKKVVEYLTDEELEMIRCACQSERDLAIVDILSGSGMRVSELCGLNRDDVDIERGEMKVYGKGQKERICYLTGRAKVHLRWYLESRRDNNPALFVSSKKPFQRLNGSSVEFILREIGQRSAIPDVRIYPHKFRKTLATQMINRGADIDQVRRLLGHADSNTTIQCYTNISNETTKYEHRKYVT